MQNLLDETRIASLNFRPNDSKAVHGSLRDMEHTYASRKGAGPEGRSGLASAFSGLKATAHSVWQTGGIPRREPRHTQRLSLNFQREVLP
jgi:hypothetical protein